MSDRLHSIKGEETAKLTEDAFVRAYETFKRELPKLVADHEGKFALVSGDHVDSFWDSFEKAAAAGYERFGADRFFVKQVRRQEQPAFVPYPVRTIKQCPK